MRKSLAIPKGGNVSLSQADPTLRTVLVGLSWPTPDTVPPFEIDASLFLLTAEGTVRDDNDFIFYNQPADAGGAVSRVSPPDLAGGPDREGFIVTLPALAADVQRLAFCLTLDTTTHPHTFGSVPWLRVRVIHHERGEELAHYHSAGELGTETALTLAELYRHHDGWKFRAVGQGYAGGLRALATHFGVLIDDSPSTLENSGDAKLEADAAPLSLDKETAESVPSARRRRRTQQDILATQVEQIKSRYRTLQPLLRRAQQDSPNESQSRLLLDRILQDVLGYSFSEIRTEQKIQGRSADYVLLADGQEALVIEAKRLGAPLRDKQIFQATSYAAYAGIRWALLTNVTTWQLYRVSTEDKVEADLVFTLDLQKGLDNDSAYLLMLVSKTGIARCDLLEKLWRKRVALSQESLLAAILNEEVLNKIRSVLARERGCQVTNQEIQDAIEREMLR